MARLNPAASPDLFTGINHHGLAGSDTVLRNIKSDSQAVVRKHFPFGRSGRAVVANLGQAAERTSRRFDQPIRSVGSQLHLSQFFLFANHDAMRIRLNPDDKVGLAHGHAQFLSLSNREGFNSVMLTNNLSASRHDLTTTVHFATPCPDEFTMMALGDKADLLTVLFFRDVQPKPRSVLTDGRFLKLTNREEHPLEQVGANPELEIRPKVQIA